MKRTRAANSGPQSHAPASMAEWARGSGCGSEQGARLARNAKNVKSASHAPFSPVTRVKGGVRAVLVLCLVLAGGLGACAPREQPPLTFEEQQDLDAYHQCRREASEMNPEWRGNTSYAPWRAYFDMCMRRMGVSKEAMRRMWL